MDGDQTARLVYLTLLLVAVAGSLVTGLRQSPGRTIQQMLIWGFIFLGLVAAYGLWPDLRRALYPREAHFRQDRMELAAAADGHFYIDATVNGAAVTFLIDTGASDVVLTRADAERAGLSPGTLDFTGRALTANGEVRTAPVTLASFRLGPYEDRDLPASVNGGELDVSLLGMRYLGRYVFTIEPDRMVLER